MEVARRAEVKPARRIFHACNSVALAFLPPLLGVGRWTVVGVLGVLFAGLLAFDLTRLRRPDLNQMFFRMVPSLASSRERVGIASSTWYTLGALLVYALFPERVWIPALLVLGFADPSASVVGRLWGRRRLGKGTVLGTAVFAAVGWAVAVWAIGPWRGLAAALLVAAVEILPWPLDDNLTVPVAAAAALTLLG